MGIQSLSRPWGMGGAFGYFQFIVTRLTLANETYPVKRTVGSQVQIGMKLYMYGGGDFILDSQYSDLWVLNITSFGISDLGPVAPNASSVEMVSKSSNSGKVAAAVVVPILVVALIGAAIAAYYFRQK
jgi:hypothetical protein